MLDDQQAARLDWILGGAVEAGYKLNRWENRFIDGLVERREEEGNRLKVTEKMWEKLEQIHRKVP